MDQNLTSEQARRALDEIGRRRDQAVAMTQPVSLVSLLVPALFILGCAALLDQPMTDRVLVAAIVFFPALAIVAFLTRRLGARARPRPTPLQILLPELADIRTARGRLGLLLWAGSLLAGLIGVAIWLVVEGYAAERTSWSHTIAAAATLVYCVGAVAARNRAWARWNEPSVPRETSS